MKTYPFKAGFPHEVEVTALEDTVARSRDLVTEPHRTDFYQVAWVQKGKATLLLDLESIPMKAGSLLFIRKHRVLMYDRSADYAGKVLRFTDGFFRRGEDDARYLRECRLFAAGETAPAVALGKDDRALRDVTGMLERELAAPNDAHQHAVLQNLVHNFLMLAERMMRPSPAPARREDAARTSAHKYADLVETGFRADRRVADYARRLGITEKRLQAATSQAFGKSPKAIIDERVALEAKRMLLFSAATVKEICFELGFDEVTNFIKWFRKQAQTTPAGFRARYRP